MKAEDLVKIGKEDLLKTAEALNDDDISQLVTILKEKDDTLRYPALLILQQYAENKSGASLFWDEFVGKLADENSYQRRHRAVDDSGQRQMGQQ